MKKRTKVGLISFVIGFILLIIELEIDGENTENAFWYMGILLSSIGIVILFTCGVIYLVNLMDKKKKANHEPAQDNLNNMKSDTKNESSEGKLILGNFSINDSERKLLKNAAIHLIPEKIDSPETIALTLHSLSAVMETFIPEEKLRNSINELKRASDEDREKQIPIVLLETVLAVNQTLGYTNPEYLKNKISSTDIEDLMRAWIVLDYYSYIIKPVYSENIRQLRDYIHSVILDSDKKRIIEEINPIKINGAEIHIDSKEFLRWKQNNPLVPEYENRSIIALTEKEPTLSLFEDCIKVREYILQTEGEEDFTGKYFHLSVRLCFSGNPSIPVALIDGFIDDDEKENKFTIQKIGYRMEVYFLACGGENSEKRYKAVRGMDLEAKALKYVGYTTPGNTRLIGVCPECKKSFSFHGYAVYRADQEPVYSDDGTETGFISTYDTIDKDSWSKESNGITFRYYNSFNCPHCKTPYIDYAEHPEYKIFGVSGCVHLGKEPYNLDSVK